MTRSPSPAIQNTLYRDKRGASTKYLCKRQQVCGGGMAAIAKDKEVPPKLTTGIPNIIKNNEIQLPKDSEGEKKVDEFGRLKDGREYRIKTIKIRARSEQLFMISFEVARCFGSLETNRFFNQHTRLQQIVLTDQERQQLARHRILPQHAKENEVSVVTARSVFREFGAQVIVGGRAVIDDYEVTIARANGRVEGELAEPEDKNFRIKYNPETHLFTGYNVGDGLNDEMADTRRCVSWDGLRRKWMDSQGDADGDRDEPDPPIIMHWLDNLPWALSPILIETSAEGIETIHVVKGFIC